MAMTARGVGNTKGLDNGSVMDQMYVQPLTCMVTRGFMFQTGHLWLLVGV